MNQNAATRLPERTSAATGTGWTITSAGAGVTTASSGAAGGGGVITASPWASVRGGVSVGTFDRGGVITGLPGTIAGGSGWLGDWAGAVAPGAGRSRSTIGASCPINIPDAMIMVDNKYMNLVPALTRVCGHAIHQVRGGFQRINRFGATHFLDG